MRILQEWHAQCCPPPLMQCSFLMEQLDISNFGHVTCRNASASFRELLLLVVLILYRESTCASDGVTTECWIKVSAGQLQRRCSVSGLL